MSATIFAAEPVVRLGAFAGAVRERLWQLPVDPLVNRIAASCRLAVDAAAGSDRQPIRVRLPNLLASPA